MTKESNTSKKDTLYQTANRPLGPFMFDEQVADVFADMIQRSVPGYRATLSMIAMMVAEYAQENSRLYDLGCSLGTTTLIMRHAITVPGCQIFAIDNSSAMINHCRKSIQRDPSTVPVEILEQNLLDTNISNASVVVMNYTLQFIPLDFRYTLLRRIYRGLKPGGVLILSEKIRFADQDIEYRMKKLHARFKLSNGYGRLEIARKREALENVLIPETCTEHTKRLTRLGFCNVMVLLKFLNFITLLSTKSG